MNLAIDIGNSRVKIGWFDEQHLIRTEVFAEEDVESLKSLTTNHSPAACILSTVKHGLAPEITSWLKAADTFIELDAGTALPFVNDYGSSQSLGRDRLAAAAGALEAYPGENCVILDAGTALTLDFLRADGHYLGGNISPGLRMRHKALHQFTARLPEVEPRALLNPIGHTTDSALQNGGFWGMVWEISGFVQYCKGRYGAIRLLMTGGDAELLAGGLGPETIIEPELVLKGLNKILRDNVEL